MIFFDDSYVQLSGLYTRWLWVDSDELGDESSPTYRQAVSPSETNLAPVSIWLGLFSSGLSS